MRYFLVFPKTPNKEESYDGITEADDQGHGVAEAVASYAKGLFECSARVGEVLPPSSGHAEQ
jgi:hypothetical protein